jgi:L-alanine-DL-glutamate epimerase-like enolase superfamily enzyme
MKIIEIETIPLLSQTPAGGWADEIDPAENLHTLLKVVTDEGVAGWGSVYTSQALVDASLKLLRPFLVGETAIEPERVAEKLHQATFWQGRGGAVTHTIS